MTNLMRISKVPWHIEGGPLQQGGADISCNKERQSFYDNAVLTMTSMINKERKEVRKKNMSPTAATGDYNRALRRDLRNDVLMKTFSLLPFSSPLLFSVLLYPLCAKAIKKSVI